MPYVFIGVKMSADLAGRMDAYAPTTRGERSAWIRDAIRRRLAELEAEGVKPLGDSFTGGELDETGDQQRRLATALAGRRHEGEVDVKYRKGSNPDRGSVTEQVAREVAKKKEAAARVRAEILARWKAEQEQVKVALAADSQMRLWQPSFVEPVNGKRTGIFGSVRIMNGQARNPHNGEDIGAPFGSDVLATNDGIVRLTVDHIFSGKGVYVDHGLGFYSMYFHLSEVLVKEGDLVKTGQIIGKVGATGRATGPHLHWGVKLNGARINPYALLDLPFAENRTGAQRKNSPTLVSPMPVNEQAVSTTSPLTTAP